MTYLEIALFVLQIIAPIQLNEIFLPLPAHNSSCRYSQPRLAGPETLMPRSAHTASLAPSSWWTNNGCQTDTDCRKIYTICPSRCGTHIRVKSAYWNTGYERYSWLHFDKRHQVTIKKRILSLFFIVNIGDDYSQLEYYMWSKLSNCGIF